MVEASSSLSERSNPEIFTHTGSPKGALKLKRTAVPGRNPISSNLTDSCSSVNPDMIAVSPGRMDATDLEMGGTLFRSSLNNGEYSAWSTILKIALPCR
jgi:hypothetical protein